MRDEVYAASAGRYRRSGVMAALVAVFPAIGVWCERSRQRRALSRLDDRLLLDIGVTRTQAAREAAKPFWRA